MKCQEIQPSLTLYILGDLSPDDQTAVKTHVDICPVCQAIVQDLRPTLDLLGDVLADTSHAPERLSPQRLANIRDLQPAVAAARERWFLRGHPRLALAASLTFVLGLCCMMISHMKAFRKSPASLYSAKGESTYESMERDELSTMPDEATSDVAFTSPYRDYSEAEAAVSKGKEDRASVTVVDGKPTGLMDEYGNATRPEMEREHEELNELGIDEGFSANRGDSVTLDNAADDDSPASTITEKVITDRSKAGAPAEIPEKADSFKRKAGTDLARISRDVEKEKTAEVTSAVDPLPALVDTDIDGLAEGQWESKPADRPEVERHGKHISRKPETYASKVSSTTELNLSTEDMRKLGAVQADAGGGIQLAGEAAAETQAPNEVAQAQQFQYTATLRPDSAAQQELPPSVKNVLATQDGALPRSNAEGRGQKVAREAGIAGALDSLDAGVSTFRIQAEDEDSVAREEPAVDGDEAARGRRMLSWWSDKSVHNKGVQEAEGVLGGDRGGEDSIERLSQVRPQPERSQSPVAQSPPGKLPAPDAQEPAATAAPAAQASGRVPILGDIPVAGRLFVEESHGKGDGRNSRANDPATSADRDRGWQERPSKKKPHTRQPAKPDGEDAAKEPGLGLDVEGGKSANDLYTILPGMKVQRFDDNNFTDRRLLRLGEEFGKAGEDAAEYRSLHDMGRADARSSAESKYLETLVSHRDALSTELMMLEQQVINLKGPDATENRDVNQLTLEMGALEEKAGGYKVSDQKRVEEREHTEKTKANLHATAEVELEKLRERQKALQIVLKSIETAEDRLQATTATAKQRQSEIAGIQTRVDAQEKAYEAAGTEQELSKLQEEEKKDALVRDKDKEEALVEARFQTVEVNPFYGVTERSMSTFSIDVDTASYTVARNYLNRGVLPPRAAVRTEEFVNFFNYAYEAPRKETFRVFTECAPSKFGRGLQLLKVGVKGRRLGREEQRRAVLTVLIDTSGSMEQPDRMGLVRKSITMLVESLGADDLVALVQYDSHARVVLEHTKAKDRKKILNALNGMQCGGSTNLEEGMSRAYALAAGSFKGSAENRVLVLSDGVANLGSVAAEDILGKVAQYRKQGITCSVFGFGMGTYDDKMLESLADKGNGAYAFVDSEGEARRLLVEDLGATLHTIASDVKIQVEFNPKRVKRYRQLGYENRQLRREDFRNDMVDAGEVGSGQSVTALYEVELMDGEKPDRADDLATVRVRYRRVDTGDVEETSHGVTEASISSRFDDTPARYRLAAAVAEFSEILRGSTHAAGSELEQVAEVLRPVAMELNLDSRVQELLRLVESAKGMSRAVQ
jgi:Ca-activated chloride channel family protein